MTFVLQMPPPPPAGEDATVVVLSVAIGFVAAVVMVWLVNRRKR